MKNSIWFFVLVTMSIMSCRTTKEVGKYNSKNYASDSTAIAKVLDLQKDQWNNGDLVGFMQGYWKDPKLTFIGGKGITYGWDQTLKNYQKGYPSRDIMGKLKFDIYHVKMLAPTAAQVIGRYTLDRTLDRPTGHFSLVFEKIAGKWLIVSDMTAADE